MKQHGLVVVCALVALAAAVKVKVVLHSEESREDATLLPFVRRARDPPPPATARPHPNDLLFPLIYRQSHINSNFKFGDNWYTWATEKRTDGSRALNYYVCYDEPKHCDDVGWERTDSVPKCAFEIDSVLADDRACLNAFGVEPRATAPRQPAAPQPAATLCDGADQMKVDDIVRSCGPRIRSLWRFVRVGRRPPQAAKPADVNSLLCEDEEECYISVEYRIHRERITFSLHEPTRGQTFKSVLRREHMHSADEAAPERARDSGRASEAAPQRPRERVRASEDAPQRPRERGHASDDAPQRPRERGHASDDAQKRPRERGRTSDDAPLRPRERIRASNDAPQRPKERSRGSDDGPERAHERARTPDEGAERERERARAADEGAEHGHVRTPAGGHRARTFRAEPKVAEEPAGYGARRTNDVHLHDDVSDDISSDGN